ncbi:MULTISPECIES: BlaI/MecI/CopY family transcriptional regulator [Pedobacter]|uniref:BlaI/MecI/CopY family transcriptional regulator n=1 Tax=Pedobacter TaxID=84567 RepID=UPI00292D4A35|nr:MULTISPECIES: BlaI/MecI/CopY family transcriptional regulator [Pedobacter]
MNKLTAKEEEVMGYFWEHGPLFVKQLQELYNEPKPHFNTLSTMARSLQEKGFLGYKAFGSSHEYHPAISLEGYNRGTLQSVVSKYFNSSYKRVVSALIEEENISIEELKKLIEEVEKKQKK